MGSIEYKKVILDKLTETLKPRQFKKSGNNYQFSNGDLTYFIQLQSSKNSTSEILKITLNIEIASSILSKLDETGMPEKYLRHYNQRISNFLDGPSDKWWIIDNQISAEKDAKEILEIMVTKVLPFFDLIKTTADLAQLWRQDKYFGLTVGQRNYYLELFDSIS